MSNDPRSRADDVVESFQQLLGKDVCAAVGEQHFQALRDMVREALAEQAEAIIEHLQQDLKNLRSEMVERRAMEI